jgi:hypothetical protein
MEKNQDPGLRINISDPQHCQPEVCLVYNYSMSLTLQKNFCLPLVESTYRVSVASKSRFEHIYRGFKIISTGM